MPLFPLPRTLILAGALSCLLGGACNGQIEGAIDPADDPALPPGVPGPGEPVPPGPSSSPPAGEPLPGSPLRGAGARRLTRDELARSLRRLLGADVPVDTDVLPTDTLTPFDNDVLEQSPSLRLVEGSEAIAREVASFATAPARIGRILPCTPSGPGDGACLSQFIRQFGRRVLRRPLADDEVQSLAGLQSHATASGNFGDGVAMVLRVLLMHPEFLYRVEPGVETAGGRVRLSPFELASRLSFLLQGMTPDDQLLAAAESGALVAAGGVEREARRLLAADEGKEQLRRFHAFWLGYSTLDTLPIQRKLRTETDALVDRATEPARDYRHLLLSDETRIDAELAAHYGMAGGDAFAWMPYAAAPRRGIFSHGMFAAAGAKFTDTSPTRRGKFIRERFLCQPVPLPPPEVAVDVDLPPAAQSEDTCKIERYRQHREDPACANCHAFMDPIGFGLENFDELGRYRTHDKDRPACVIDGKGQLDAGTTFTGARELASLVAASPRFGPCVAEHFLHFAVGRGLDDSDRRRALWLGGEMGKGGNSFTALVLAFVTHENFRYRQE